MSGDCLDGAWDRFTYRWQFGSKLGIVLLDNDGTAWSKTWIELERLPATEGAGKP